MKTLLIITFLGLSVYTMGQSKNERTALANASLLEATVFETKDSVTLEKLFAKTLHYEHSNGKVETREQALHGISHNKSVYVKPAVLPTAAHVLTQGDSIIVNNQFKAIENKADGTSVNLDFTVTTVWIEENGDLKLARRKATKNVHN